MYPHLGQVVLYQLTAEDAQMISRRRTTAEAVRNRLRRNPPEWPEGAQAHLGEAVAAGQLLPLVITRTQDEGAIVSGQVLLNGTDSHWVQSIAVVTDGPPENGQAIAVPDHMGLEAAGGAGRRSSRRE